MIAQSVKKKNPHKKIIKGKAITPNISLEADYYSQLYFMVNTIKKRFINIVMSEMEKDSVKEQFQDASYVTIMNKESQI